MTHPIDTYPVRTTWAATVFAAVAAGFLYCITEADHSLAAMLPEMLGASVGMFLAMTYLRRRRARRRGEGGTSA